jgi:hypothetical protein
MLVIVKDWGVFHDKKRSVHSKILKENLVQSALIHLSARTIT